MDTNINRVYVNPNFNRVPSRTVCVPEPLYSKNNLYVNPNFIRNKNDVPQFTNLNRKIYVNPSFIKTTNVVDTNDARQNASDINYTNLYLENLNTRDNNFVQAEQKIENSKPLESVSIHSPSKSKYRLIRKNDRVLEKELKNKESSTIKINKYKSIPFQNYINNLQMVRNITTKQIITGNNNTSTSKPQFVRQSCFKLIRHNSQATIKNPHKLIQKTNSQKCKKVNSLKFQLKLKVINGVRKKNNIPCRLFTKYGMCLRNLYGTCEYLHDKKHVSLCRKFLKGICHDKQCLLSHELSSKKMPTCFFYLKGKCMKDDCQYLHVKLNDKSKICHDFLKGYCDKGNMCMHRHIRPETDKKNNNKRYSSSGRSNQLHILKSVKTNQLRKQTERDFKKLLKNCPNEQVVNDVDCRYFKDLQNKDAMCQVLKPTRCKLGILPSFIHL